MESISVGTEEQSTVKELLCCFPPKLWREFLLSCVFSSRHLYLDMGTADAIATKRNQGSTALFSNLCDSFPSFPLAFELYHLRP